MTFEGELSLEKCMVAIGKLHARRTITSAPLHTSLFLIKEASKSPTMNAGNRKGEILMHHGDPMSSFSISPRISVASSSTTPSTSSSGMGLQTSDSTPKCYIFHHKGLSRVRLIVDLKTPSHD